VNNIKEQIMPAKEQRLVPDVAEIECEHCCGYGYVDVDDIEPSCWKPRYRRIPCKECQGLGRRVESPSEFVGRMLANGVSASKLAVVLMECLETEGSPNEPVRNTVLDELIEVSNEA